MLRLSVVVLLLVGAACGSAENRTGSPDVSDSAGVTIVSNKGTDSLLPWSLTLQHRLGLDEDSVAVLTRMGPSLAGSDASGRIFLLNTGAARVEVYDTTGAQLATYGRRGGGPGEFRFAARLMVHPNGQVDVVDYQKGAVVQFSPDGTFMPEVSYLTYGFPFTGLVGTPSTGIRIVPRAGVRSGRLIGSPQPIR